MTTLRSRRLRALLSIAVVGAGGAVAATPAPAQLAGAPPNLGTIVTQTGDTLAALVPGTSGVVTGVTGTVGGVVGSVAPTVTGVVDGTLGNVIGGEGGTLPPAVVDTLLGTLLNSAGGGTGPPGGGGGPIVLSGGQVGPGGVILDASAPRPTVRVLSRLRQIGRSGRMRIEIRSNEPGIVAIAGRIRPGAAARAGRGGRAARHSRRLIGVPQIVLGYRRAGRLIVTLRLSRAAQRALGRSRSARMSVGSIAVDLFRNQASERAKIRIVR